MNIYQRDQKDIETLKVFPSISHVLRKWYVSTNEQPATQGPCVKVNTSYRGKDIKAKSMA